jgi:hypothetical protein
MEEVIRNAALPSKNQRLVKYLETLRVAVKQLGKGSSNVERKLSIEIEIEFKRNL